MHIYTKIYMCWHAHMHTHIMDTESEKYVAV